jgi:hydrogenase nickel incorporation protein HypA/HybF
MVAPGPGGDVHELSIALSLIDEAAGAARSEGYVRVMRVHARIGVLSGVVHEALQFSFQMASPGTACEDAVLEIEEVPIQVRCPVCQQVVQLPNAYRFVCPTCGTPTPEVVAGRELELVSIEVDDDEAASA